MESNSQTSLNAINSLGPLDPTSSEFSLETAWIENLALDELHMEESGVVNFTEHLNPAVHLEESSVNFVNLLRDLFETFIQKFNAYRGHSDPSSVIKVFKISNTVNDFMLYRNSLKLVVARKTADCIVIGLVSNSGGTFAARSQAHPSPAQHRAGTFHEVKAHIGPFNDISWRFVDEIVNPKALVKHYLTEFIKHSAK